MEEEPPSKRQRVSDDEEPLDWGTDEEMADGDNEDSGPPSGVEEEDHFNGHYDQSALFGQVPSSHPEYDVTHTSACPAACSVVGPHRHVFLNNYTLDIMEKSVCAHGKSYPRCPDCKGKLVPMKKPTNEWMIDSGAFIYMTHDDSYFVQFV